MSQLNLLDAPAPEVEDIWEKEYFFEHEKKYWQEFSIGQVLLNTTAGDYRAELCILLEIVEEVFGLVRFLKSGEKEFVSLCCLIPASEKDMAKGGYRIAND